MHLSRTEKEKKKKLKRRKKKREKREKRERERERRENTFEESTTTTTKKKRKEERGKEEESDKRERERERERERRDEIPAGKFRSIWFSFVMANEKINGMVERRDAEASTSGTSTWQGGGLGQREVERYARQLVMPKFGLEGQTKLRSAKVLVVGAGGLGSPVCLYLAAAGIGTLGVVDQDQVETSNLHRQILHGEEQVGVHKSLSAKIAVNRINSNTKVETHLDGFRPQGALQLVSR